MLKSQKFTLLPLFPNCDCFATGIFLANIIIMYVYEGRKSANSKRREIDIYTMDVEFHRRLVRRWAKSERATDDWEPNRMFKKRDFQDINPPKTVAEFYGTYQPSIGWGTGIALGSILLLMLIHVLFKWIYKQWKRFKTSKFFVKHFTCGSKTSDISSPGLTSNSTPAKQSTLNCQNSKRTSLSVAPKSTKAKEKETLLVLRPPEIKVQDLPDAGIQVHITGPSPCPSQKCLATLLSQQDAESLDIRNNNNNNNEYSDMDAQNKSPVVTIATVEMRPLLFSASSNANSPVAATKAIYRSDSHLPSGLPLVHESKFLKSHSADSSERINNSNGNISKQKNSESVM